MRWEWNLRFLRDNPQPRNWSGAPLRRLTAVSLHLTLTTLWKPFVLHLPFCRSKKRTSFTHMEIHWLEKLHTVASIHLAVSSSAGRDFFRSVFFGFFYWFFFPRISGGAEAEHNHSVTELNIEGFYDIKKQLLERTRQGWREAFKSSCNCDNAVNSKQGMLIFILRSCLTVDLGVGHLSRDKPLFVKALISSD